MKPYIPAKLNIFLTRVQAGDYYSFGTGIELPSDHAGLSYIFIDAQISCETHADQEAEIKHFSTEKQLWCMRTMLSKQANSSIATQDAV